MELAIDDLCRLCLKEGGEMEHLFCVRNDRIIADLASLIFPTLNIKEFDNLPKYICTDCLGIIVSANDLHEKSRESEDYLNSIVKDALDFEMIIEEEETNEDEAVNCVNSEPVEPTRKLKSPPASKISQSVSKSKPPRLKDAVECFICNIVLSRKSLSRHMKTVHDQQNFRKKDYEASKFAVQNEPLIGDQLKAGANQEKLPKSRCCKWCPQRFQNFTALTQHLTTHHAELYLEEQEIKSHRPIGCSFCVARFSTISNMKLHLKKVHNLDPNLLIYYCDQCSYSANDKFGLEIHVKEIHLGISGKPYQCIVCKTRFIHVKNLRNHLITKHKIADKGTFLCDNCDFHTGRRSEYLIRIFKDKIFIIPFLVYLEIHMQRVHLKTVDDFLCNLCDIVSKTFQEKSLHQSYCHCDIVESLDLNLEVLNCSMCPSQFYDSNDLLEHLSSHEEEAESNVPTACILCSKVVKGYAQIFEHTKNHHFDKFTHRCLVCNRSFIYGLKFLIHVKNHKEKKPLIHLCNECGQSFPTSSHLKKHTKVEHEKIYSCPYCINVVYKTITAYRQHVDGHTNTRKYRCPMCPKTFAIRNKFKNHYAFHLNDKVRI